MFYTLIKHGFLTNQNARRSYLYFKMQFICCLILKIKMLVFVWKCYREIDY